ncbi:MAG: hypothetical protein ABJE47_18320, partial [bacterium]
FAGEIPPKEVWNIADLASRMVSRNRQTSAFHTREDLKRLGIEWVYDAVQMSRARTGAKESYDRDCVVTVDGGPRTTELGALTVDDIEAIEIYAPGAGSTTISRANRDLRAGTNPTYGVGKLGTSASVLVPLSNLERARSENQSRSCPTMYVWAR